MYNYYLMESIRKDIEDIDIKILELLNERFKKAELVAKYKKNNNLPILDESREKMLLDKLREKNIINPNYIFPIWNEIFNISKMIQEKFK